MENTHTCLICDEGITNPISPERLQLHVQEWLYDMAPSLAPVMREIGNAFTPFKEENTSCIITGKNMNVCPHCYCYEIYTWMIENNYVELADQFKEQFNFELDTNINPGMVSQIHVSI